MSRAVIVAPDFNPDIAGVAQLAVWYLTVPPGGPAAQAGLRPDDVITSIDGEPATSNLQLQELTLTKKPGDIVPIGYTKAGHSATTTVTLGAQP
jgi:putative serine protease PepD